MANHDEPELRIVEVKGSFPALQVRKPVPQMLRRSAPTRAEALEGLRAMKGAASVIERLPALEDTTTWGETAFWSVCTIKGAAFDPFFWDCDFANNGFPVEFAADNCVVMFWGTEPMGSLEGPITPPGTLTGQVWCDLEVSVTGNYLFVAQVSANGDPPDYMATVEFCIDYLSLGQRQLFAGGPFEQSFVLYLSPGIHRFIIKQVLGIFFFSTLSAWQIPIFLHEEPEQQVS
jgi:hypothetical protein